MLTAFLPQPGALHHAKSVLLIDHHEAQVAKPHHILDQGMGSNQDIYFPGKQPCVDLLPLFLSRGTGQ